MANPTYSTGTIRSLIESDAVTEPTRKVLCARLDSAPVTQPKYFDAATFAILRAACARLFPQSERAQSIEIASGIDERLSEGKGDGWRYDAMPPDGKAFRRGLCGLGESAKVLYGADFVALNTTQQDEVLRAVQNGTAPGQEWQTLPSSRFFEELLADATENYYAHPLAQEEIGYEGFADKAGWTKIGLNEHEPVSVAGDRWSVAGAEEAKPTESRAPFPITGHRPPTTEVDVVVIGTGAGGAPLLARLARAGLKVVALEAGKHWNPQRDFATDEKAQSKLFWTDERLSAGDDPLHFGNNNSGIGVGGSTLHYTAYTPRVQPDDLNLYSEFGVGRDWPLKYFDLEPYYDELEAFLGISGPAVYPWGPARQSTYPLAPLPLNGAAQLMQRGCDKLGIQTSPAANAALSAKYFQPGVGWRNACTNRGFCQAGCSTGAKASMDVTFLPLAIEHGGEIRAECFVTQIETDATGRVTAVIYTRNGQAERQPCKNVFLCGGAIETPRLLLMNELGNASGQVGRNFMAHTGLQIWGRFDEEVRPYKGIPGALISEDTHRPKDADFAGGYLLQSIGVMPVTYASQVARGKGIWGDAMREHMRGYNHTAGINILGDCLPYAGNFMELSDEKDARGLPKPRIHFSNGDNEKRLNAHAENIMCAIWKEAGAREMWKFDRNAHIIGTCVMGSHAKDSVVDADGRSWEIPNLFICDNSVFPSALSANPALTIMALSLRTADRFLDAQRGEI